MLPTILLAAMLSLSQTPPPAGEPDGSRTIGIVPPFHADPTPPDWLRAASHSIAAVDTRHYVYEVYVGPDSQWLVRYLMLPESGEAFREVEQAFLFGPDPAKKPKEVVPSEVNFESRSAIWKKMLFKLVDRRDLMKP
jgi:hypothetical protein